MQRRGRRILYSPSDLVRFFASPWSSWMDRLDLERPGSLAPDREEESSRVLAERGAEHERRVLERFAARHGPALAIGRGAGTAEATRRALDEGRALVAQAALEHGDWRGYADLLVRVGTTYEIWDAKLARAARPRDLLQLGAYALLLERSTGLRAVHVGLALGDGSELRLRADDVLFHARSVERAFLESMASFDATRAPDPEPNADHGRWSQEAERFFERTDHLVQVAGITRGQIQKLRAAGLHTVEALASSRVEQVPGLRASTLATLREQSALQVQARGAATIPYRVLPPTPDDPRRGLARLPPPSAGDVVLDLEGYPLAEEGLEYLFGVVARGERSGRNPDYRAWWAHDADQERLAVEAFLTWLARRRTTHPTLRVYHYAAYEVNALKRLVARYAVAEEILDDLLRGNVFVDLYPVVHQGLRIGVSSYSIKQIERLYRGARAEAVSSGLGSIVAYERWQASGEGPDPARSPALEAIRAYNEADCRSTWELLAWLRERQREAGIAHVEPAPSGRERDDARPLSEANLARQALATQMLAQVPALAAARASERERWQVQTLLAQLLEFHRREEKPMWWAHFERLTMSPDDLVADPDSIGRLARAALPEERIQRSTGVWYDFEPEQETRLEAGDDAQFLSGARAASVSLVRFEESATGRRVLLKVGPTALQALGGHAPRSGALIPSPLAIAEPLRASIERVARAFHADRSLPASLTTLFLRQPPRLARGSHLPDDAEMLDPVAAGQRVARALRDTTLCVQGPPGTGKTYVGARMIAALLADGKNVGIASNSHKAIHNLLAACEEAVGPGFRARKGGAGGDETFFAAHPAIDVVPKNGEAAEHYEGGLIAGTAWLFAAPALAGRLDTLFVDEAGQVSLANLVAMAPSARNLVLLGDQMQLAQPSQGTHPGESGTSALLHLLEGHATIPPELGLFLPVTRRLHPDVCRVVSGLAYEDRLVPHRSTVNRVVRVPVPLAASARVRQASGVLFVPCEHEGNAEASEEEAALIADLVTELVGREFTDATGRVRGRLGPDDVMIVAPYNLQVNLLRKRVGPQARVGTVDRFQGQEAPVVILSLCVSFGEAGARGLDFVLDKNRLNVALSRAESLALVVGDPRLVRSPCRSVSSLLRLNLLARLLG